MSERFGDFARTSNVSTHLVGTRLLTHQHLPQLLKPPHIPFPHLQLIPPPRLKRPHSTSNRLILTHKITPDVLRIHTNSVRGSGLLGLLILAPGMQRQLDVLVGPCGIEAMRHDRTKDVGQRRGLELSI